MIKCVGEFDHRSNAIIESPFDIVRPVDPNQYSTAS